MFKNIIVSFLVILTLFQLSCSLPEVTDINPPIVTMIFPVGGAVLTESVVISISAADDKEVKQVWYYFDGELMESKSGSIADFELDLSPFQDNQFHVFQGGASDEAGNKGYSVQVVVLISDRTDITPPDVAITSPQDGVIATDSVKVSVNAFDAGGINRVAFFVDGDSVATDSFYPYEYIWSFENVPAGTQQSIQAKAFDNAGNWSLSNQVRITKSVDNVPPVVAITNPLDGQSFETSVNIVAGATDNIGVREVAFFVNGDSVFTDKSYPYEYLLSLTDIPEGGQKIVRAKAYDLSGNFSLSASVTVNRSLFSDLIPPDVAITNPLDGQSFATEVTIVANASDNIGIAEVAFWVDGDSVVSDNSYPYEYLLSLTDIPEGGQKTVIAKAFDTSGNWNLSAPVTVIRAAESDITAPVIAILYPLAGTTITGTVTIALDVQDDVGVQRVEFYIDGGIDGQPNQTLQAPPWNYDWDTGGLVSGSSHTLYIKAYDAAGNVGTSGPVGYTIQ